MVDIIPRPVFAASVLLSAALLWSVSTGSAHAQNHTPEALPVTRYFHGPFADPIEPRMSIGLLVSNVLSRPGNERNPFTLPDPEDSRSDWQAAANIGGTIPLVRFGQDAHGGFLLAAQAGVHARFRIEYPSRDELSTDWIVAGALEYAHDNLSGRFRLSHRSSHLGDEFVVVSEAARVEFGGEAFDLQAAWTLTDIARFYGGISWIFRSYTRHLEPLVREGIGDCCVLQLGADGAWHPFPNRHLELVAGIDWQAAERVRWRSNTSLAGGLTYRAGTRSAGFVARLASGRSALGQFYNTPERAYGVEFIATF